MIHYLCKYTPIEILQSFGEEVGKLEPQVADFEMADKYMHNNMCSYVKAILEECMTKGAKKMVVMNSCDSSRRLYDVLKTQGNFVFLYLIDVPRKKDEKALDLFKKELEKFIEYCEKHFGKKFDPGALIETIRARHTKGDTTAPSESRVADSDAVTSTESSESASGRLQRGVNGVNIAITGARASEFFNKTIEDAGVNILYNFTCTGKDAEPVKLGFKTQLKTKEDVLIVYAQYLLNSYPCMRMIDVGERFDVLNSIQDKIQGLVYHSVKFCEYYSTEFAELKKKLKIPILRVETDYTTQSYGQIKTRIGAFVEKLKKTETPPQPPSLVMRGKQTPSPYEGGGTGRGVFVAGMDSGSQSTNAVVLDQDKKIVAYSIVDTGARSLESAQRAYDEALKKANLRPEDIEYVVATGYGRVSIPFADEHVTEITCHAKGAHYSNPEVRTIIDVGGQDSKVIRLSENGEVKDFAMNDKCAAGTGKFLQAMARTLEVPLEEMGEHSLRAKEEVKITSMCTVFAESEVISLIPQNKDKADIIKGIHSSIVRRTISLLDRVGRQGKYMMTGGVAKNIGVIKELEDKIGEKIYLPDEPQIAGALGAALFALEYTKGEK